MHQKSLKGDIENETFDLESRPVAAAHDVFEHSQLVTVLKAGDEVRVGVICRKQNGICARCTAKRLFATIPDVVVASVGGFESFCVDKRCPAIQAECGSAPGAIHCCAS